VNNRDVLRIEGGMRVNALSSERQPVVSIITAVLNGSETLAKTIESVIVQTYPHKEFIVIDGGSTDETLNILRKFDCAIDYWISEPDNGVYDALNKGIGLARGEWLYFLGADDSLVDPWVLERIFSTPRTAKMIYGNVYFGPGRAVYDGVFTRQKLALKNICHQSIFYRKELFEKFGTYEQDYRLLADYVFNMKCFGKSESEPCFVDTIIACYSGEGISQRIKDHKFERERFRLIRANLGMLAYCYALMDYLRGTFITWAKECKKR
jgi:hypothetical protein